MVLGSFLGLPVSGSMTTLPFSSFRGLPLLGSMMYSRVSGSNFRDARLPAA